MSGIVAAIPIGEHTANTDLVVDAIVGQMSPLGKRVAYTVSMGGNASLRIVDHIGRSATAKQSVVSLHDGAGVPCTSEAYQNVCSAGDLFAAWIGNPTIDRQPLSAKSLTADLKDPDSIVRWTNRVMGNFLIVMHHHRSGWYVFIGDRQSTLSLYYTQHAGLILTSSEPLSLGALSESGWKPAVRASAVYEFIACGHLLGSGTWLSEVSRLGPGDLLWIERDKLQVASHWKAQTQPERRSSSDLEDELVAAIHADCDLLPAGKAVLTLSGGYDSRALLGLMQRSGRDFEAVSYGWDEQFRTDGEHDVAGYFAKKLNVRHETFIAKDTSPDRIISSFWDASRATGGEQDAVLAQDAFLGNEFHQDLADRFDYLVRGDECWNWRDYVFTRRAAQWQSLMLRLDQQPQARRYLTPAAFAEGTELLDELHREFLAAAPATRDPNILKDYLTWRHRETRLLCNMSQYRRMFLPHETPFLYGNSMNVARKAPIGLRLRKRLFLRTMKHDLPELFLDPKMPSPFTPRVSRFERFFQTPALSAFVRELLVTNPPASLAARADLTIVDAWIDREAQPRSQRDSSSRRQDFLHLVYGILRKNRYTVGAVSATLAALGRLRYPAIDNIQLFRLMNAAMALRSYERFASPAPPVK